MTTAEKIVPRLKKTNTGRILDQLAEKLTHRSLIVLLSDFFDDLTGLEKALRHLRYKKHELMVFQILDPAAFLPPSPGVAGTMGRNSLIGPGFWSIDFSIARSIPLARLSESARLQIRADAFNVFNHSNLGNPDARQSSPDTFGQAQFGRRGVASNFEALTPIEETPRRIQLQLRISF